MEFDKNRVFSAVNAGELYPGDKVVVADCIADLKELVKDKGNVVELERVLDEKFKLRFKAACTVFLLAYLVERKANCTNCGMKSECKDANIENPEIHNCLMWENIGERTE